MDESLECMRMIRIISFLSPDVIVSYFVLLCLCLFMYDGLMGVWVCIRIRMVTCLPPYVTIVVSLCLCVFV